MQITLGKMRKRPNSTKRTLSASTTINVVLKDAVTVENPTFILHTDPSGYNYVVWGDKYYYIDCNNVRILANNEWEVPCSMDVLATFRDTIRYGIRGVMSYSSLESDWDVYADDYRFNPTYLSNNSSTYPDLSTGSSKHTNSNIFGLDSSSHHYPKLWDATFSSGSPDYTPHVTAVGSGMYVMVTLAWTHILTNPVAGKRIYLLNEDAYMSILSDPKFDSLLSGNNAKYILSLMWMPIRLSELITHLTDRYNKVTEVCIGNDVFDISSSGNAYIMTANPCTISFNNQMSFPDITGGSDEEYPVFYQNSRWSSMQLITPSGTYNINLDSIYPYSWDGRVLSFSTTFDVLNGVVNVKYTIDNKPNQGFLDSVAPVIYESNICIGLDVLNEVLSEPNSGVIASTTGRVGQAALQSSSIFSAFAGVKEIAAPLAAISPAASGVGAIALASGLVPEANAPVVSNTPSSIITTGTFLSLINSVQLGMITLRLKTYTCNEIETGNTISGRYAIDRYKSFCSLHGYPANKLINTQATPLALNNRLVIYRNATIDVSNTNTIPDGISRDDILYILNILQTSGVWLEQ